MNTKKLILGLILGLSAVVSSGADVAISALPSASALSGTEDIPAVQSATTVKTTPSAVRTYMLGTTSTWTATQTFVTPALGTPASGVLTNATGLPAAGVVGTAAILGSNAFTGTQTFSPSALTSATGYSVSISPTWSSTGTQTALLVNPTNTASGSGSLLADFRASGLSVATVTVNGGIRTKLGTSTDPAFGPTSMTSGSGLWFGSGGSEMTYVYSNGNNITFGNAYTKIRSDGVIGFNSTTNSQSGTADVGIARNAVGELGIDGGTQGSRCSTVANCRDLRLRHLMAGGTAPTVAGSCGSSPTIAGGDTAMTITAGTGSPTSCTVTFGTAFANAPVCTANAATTTTALNVATTTTTVIVSAAALTASEKLQVICIGY